MVSRDLCRPIELHDLRTDLIFGRQKGCNMNRQSFTHMLAMMVGITKTTSIATAANESLAADSMLATKQQYSKPEYAPSARKRIPYSISIGAYFPNFTSSGLSNSTGVDIWFAYTYPNDTFDVRSTSRSQTFSIKGGGNGTANVGSSTVDFLFRSEGFYYGPGIGIGSATVSNDIGTFTSSTVWVLSATVGYDLNPRMFVEAHYQTASEDLLKGFSVSFGYRF